MLSGYAVAFCALVAQRDPLALCACAQASVDLAYALTLEKDLYNRAGGLAGA